VRPITTAVANRQRSSAASDLPRNSRTRFAWSSLVFGTRYRTGSVCERHSWLRSQPPVHRGESEIRIVDIALLPDYRGNGIGTALLRDLFSEADAAGKTVTIHVERFNPALRLYERLGFALAEDKGVYLFLERPPAT
jgi:ribosomal protein S18 acetylase RimI-like enzyme